jgi:hypothetical protein
MIRCRSHLLSATARGSPDHPEADDHGAGPGAPSGLR